ncbi:MAG: tetratricopeptide repeat protein [Candidatus Gastranaerophilales bacterium]|nr:tetratricopeptide repeat protein [Candidatus Gastranaerophilales bacterium]
MKKIFNIIFFILMFFMVVSASFAQEPATNYALIKQQGMEAYNKGDYATALKYLTSIPRSQHTLDIVICTANCYESLGDIRSAVLLLESLNKQNYNNYSAFYNLGNIYLKAEIYKNAIESYKLATRMNTRFAPAFYNLGIAYYKTNDVNKALFNFEKAMRLNPSNKDYIYNAAICLETLGDKKTAEEYFKKAGLKSQEK